jgi:hypothetical protein
MDYLSPLNLTSSVGGTLGVGGIDVNSPHLGCSADRALALQVVTPTGDRGCSIPKMRAVPARDRHGQFGVITGRHWSAVSRVTLLYYSSLRAAIEDLQVDAGQASDYSGILTMMDKAITLLVAFDSDERELNFDRFFLAKVRGKGEAGFALQMAFHYALRPWRLREALYLWTRKRALFPEFRRPEHLRDGKMHDRTVVFSRAVWRHWGSRQMGDDLATSAAKFRSGGRAADLPQVLSILTLYCRLACARTRGALRMSSIPPDAKGRPTAASSRSSAMHRQPRAAIVRTTSTTSASTSAPLPFRA